MTAPPKKLDTQPLLIFSDESDVWDGAVCQKLRVRNNIKLIENENGPCADGRSSDL